MNRSEAAPATVGVWSLGCARNLTDSELALGSAGASGFRIISDAEKADIALVNTCGFTGDARRESAGVIRRLLFLKRKSQIQKVVVLGCLGQKRGKALLKDFPGIDAVLGVQEFEKLGKMLKALGGAARSKPEVRVHPVIGYLPSPQAPFKTLTLPHVKYIKISEGCINACSYCAIPSMKGAHRSRGEQDILSEARAADRDGRLREIVLIGQDTGVWGSDLPEKPGLERLLRKLSAAFSHAWIRFLYCHPAHLTEGVMHAMRELPNVCRYADLPIEHSHPEILKRMRRGITRSMMDQKLDRIRAIVPGVVVRTSVMTGFPGESREEFDDLRAYLKERRFEWMGAFEYSREQGTAAWGLKPQIAPLTAKKRRLELMKLQKTITNRYQKSRLGKPIRVLIEFRDAKGLYHARSQSEAPEVDGRILVRSRSELPVGEFIRVLPVRASAYELRAVPA